MSEQAEANDAQPSEEIIWPESAELTYGYLLADDLAHLNDYIEKYDIRWLLTDSSGRQYTNPDVPPTTVLDSGTIELRAGNGSGMIADPRTEFPNYDAHVENGTWSVIPRTVTVEWEYANGSWTAKLGNLLPGDEVSASVDADGTLTLTGADAADAMTWAVEQGIIAGSNGSLLPKSGVTRAQTALMLQRFAARQAQ